MSLFTTTSNTNIGPTITYLDFINQSRQRLDAWFRRVTDSVYGDLFTVSVGAQSIPSGVSTKINFSTGQSTNNCFVFGTGKFTPTKAGWYRLLVQLRFNNTFASGVNIYSSIITDSGGGISGGAITTATAGETPLYNYEFLLPLSEGQNIHLEVFQNSGSSAVINGLANSFLTFYGNFIRPL